MKDTTTGNKIAHPQGIITLQLICILKCGSWCTLTEPDASGLHPINSGDEGCSVKHVGTQSRVSGYIQC